MGVVADRYQRSMMKLLPPGRIWRFVGSLLTKLFAGASDELERVDVRAGQLLRESKPANADELLAEYEADLDLAPDGTNAQRVGRVVGRFVARQRYRPVDFQVALAPMLGQLAADVEVIETSHAVAVSMGDDREIYEFFIYRDPTLPNAYDVEGAQALVDKIKPSHTLGHVIESVDFCCDDPYSLCDRDLLGA